MDLSHILTVASITVIPLLLAITVHEVAHGLLARRYGDRTAEAQGRLTLNPIKHIDPVGTIVVPLLQLVLLKQVWFGWAKPVPVNPRYLRNPRGDMAKVAVGGPAANLGMAIIWAGVLAALGTSAQGVNSLAWVQQMALYGVLINVLLAVFNLLPVLPLDGGRVLANLLPPGPVSRLLESLEPYGMLIVIVLLVSNVAWVVIGPVTELVETLIFKLVGLS